MSLTYVATFVYFLQYWKAETLSLYFCLKSKPKVETKIEETVFAKEFKKYIAGIREGLYLSVF